MKIRKIKISTICGLTLLLALGMCAGCTGSKNKQDEQQVPDFSAESRVAHGKPVSVMLTAYSTTLLANGQDHALLRIAVLDSLGREITSATDSIRVYVQGDARLTDTTGRALVMHSDTAGAKYAACRLLDGLCYLTFVAGTHPDKVKVEARSGKLWPGGHEIHTLPADFVMKKPTGGQLSPTTLPIGRMIGADISFLPQLQDRGIKFYENGQPVDAIHLLHHNGMNYIRLRIFVDPANPDGYSPGKGYCGLDSTLMMARRVKDAGMKLLLDFHYSDYWADPQKQFKPQAWKDLDFATLKDTVKAYTARVLQTFRKQNVLPDMVQTGNEINHGILWPDGHISHPDQLEQLLQAGVEGVRGVDPGIPVMMHLALGGQNKEARFWLNNMIARGLQFDLIGLSYYPRWHGTLEDLYNNVHDLAPRYHKPINIVEYSDFIEPVHRIIFSLPDSMGKGACIWEPLNRRSGLFDSEGNVTPKMQVYDTLHRQYLSGIKK